MISEDDSYLWACMNANIPTERIAQKLSLTVAEVENRYLVLKSAVESQQKVGVDHLVNAFTAHAFQYQVLGESLKLFGNNISNPVPPQAIKDLLVEGIAADGHLIDPDETVKRLMSSFIILYPFEAPEVGG